MRKVVNRDYDIMQELIRAYVKEEMKKTPQPVKDALFYESVKGILEFYRTPQNELSMKQLVEVQKRYEKGKGNEREAKKFREYFYRKMLPEIKYCRKKMTGNKYSRRQVFR